MYKPSLTRSLIVILFATLMLLFGGCKDDNPSEDGGPTGTTTNPLEGLNLPATPFNYANPTLPAFYQQPLIVNADNTPMNNPVTDDGATLGRVLFYEKNISYNRTVSCASCHQQSNGFSDPLVFSEGFDGGATGRHSMSLANAAYYNTGRFFWDERANTLEDQVLMPIQDAIEMGMTLEAMIERLEALDYYPTLFRNAFGDETITIDRVSKALAQFVRSMVSYQSKFDVGRAQVNNPNAPLPNFSTLENQGKQLFFGRGTCGACHGTDAFIAPGPRNNGLAAVYTDRGVGDVTGNPRDNGRFKTPSLKNIALTAPYMHDGSLATLEEIVEHYSTGVQAHPNLDPPLRLPNGQARLLNLTQNEKDALVAFLHTLTDQAMVTDEKFSDPFTN